jgi:hypothetical protein
MCWARIGSRGDIGLWWGEGQGPSPPTSLRLWAPPLPLLRNGRGTKERVFLARLRQQMGEGARRAGEGPSLSQR